MELVAVVRTPLLAGLGVAVGVVEVEVAAATNRASAKFLFSSELLDQEVDIEIPDYQSYIADRT